MKAIVRRSLGVLVAVLAVVTLWVVVSLSMHRPVTYVEITDHFKNGSIGSEPGVSLLQPVGGVLPPYSVFSALPSICPEKLPGGYASLGFVFEPGHDLPVGVSRRRRIGIDHVGLNCAVCHTSTVRDTPTASPRVVLGMPAAELDLQSFVQFVLDCTLDNRTTSEAVLGHVKQMRDPPSLFERTLIRFGGLVDRVKLPTRALRNRAAPASIRSSACSVTPAAASAKESSKGVSSARSTTSTASAPIGIDSIHIRTCSRRTSTRSIPSRSTGSRISARRAATRTSRSTVSGCADRTCTTDRCRRFARSSTRQSSGRRRSTAATTSLIDPASGSCGT